MTAERWTQYYCALCMDPLPKGRRKFCCDKCRKAFRGWEREARKQLKREQDLAKLLPAGVPSEGGPQ